MSGLEVAGLSEQRPPNSHGKPKENAMQISVETITPDTAREYLKANVNNRHKRPAHIDALARDIAAGNWKVNGDAIRFNCDGELLDGQHRLNAVVKAERAIETLVIRGLAKDTRLTMDTGAKRSAADHLSLQGIKYANEIAAACRYAVSARRSGTMRPLPLTHSEIWDFYQAHTGIAEDIHLTKAKVPSGYGPIVAGLAYAVGFANHGFRREILDGWLYGEGGRDHPCVVARERAIKDTTARANRRGLITQAKCRLVGHSMVKTLHGERVTIARIPDSVVIPGWSE